MFWKNVKVKNLEIVSGGNLKGVYGVPGKGKVYYVNGGSDGPTSNAYDGLSPSTPKQTLKAALALCTSNYNDTIYVLNYGANARAVEDWPIVVTKDQVHIIGVGTKPNKWATVTATGSNKSAFDIQAFRVEIAGLEIGGTGTGAGVAFTIAGGHGCYIHDCWFGMSDGVGTNGVKVSSGDAPRIRIEDCDFGMLLTGVGIIVASTFGAIVGNRFLRCPGAAMQVGGDGVMILDNQVCMDADTVNHGIYVTTTNGYIDGNHVASQKTATTADRGLVDAGSNNAWGINYSGIVADLPA